MLENDLRNAPKYQKPALILGGLVTIAAAFYAGMWYANPQPIVAGESQSESEYPEPSGITYLADNPGTFSETCEGGSEYACALDRENARYAAAKKEYLGLVEALRNQGGGPAENGEDSSRQADSALGLLEEYDKAWGPYLKYYCRMHNIPLNVVGMGGWNTSSIECRIFETETYIKNLQFFRESLENFGILRGDSTPAL